MPNADFAVTAASVGDLTAVIPARIRSLRADNKSPKTTETYSDAANLLLRFLWEHGMPTESARITREHVETFIAELLARFKPATASNPYCVLARVFVLLVDEGGSRPRRWRG